MKHDYDKEGDSSPSHIVGIGASAGGLNALELFFENLQVDSGMAFVVIQHLSPDFKSLMDDLLSRRTSVPIHSVTGETELRPNTIYLSPPRFQMTLTGGKLLLEEKPAGQHLELPIDIFFRSLAEDAREKAIAVVLSGTGSDGSRGIQKIKQEGGLVVVQTPESAQFDGMPRSAIATGAWDFQLTPERIPYLLVDYKKDSHAVRSRIHHTLDIYEDEGKNAEIFALMRKHFNLDFSRYKAATVERRIERRMSFKQISNASDYAAILAGDREEMDALYMDLLIGVTEFFRDPKAFEFLEQEVIPALFKKLSPEDEMRVWCAACATGEEAYSLAILFSEAAERLGFRGRITIFATDVHRTSLDTASAGLYSAERLANLSPALIAKHFRPEGHELYKVSAELRKMVVVAPHNLISDPPFTKMDLITCRNLLIYFQPETQEKVISIFHFGLKVGGALFLGSSEGLGPIAAEFETLEPRFKIFSKVRDLKLSIDFGITRYYHPTQTHPASEPGRNRMASLDRQILNDYDLILKKHVPPGVLINEERQVIHYFGNVADYLKPPAGRVENDILSMIHNDLYIAVSTALQRVLKDRTTVVTKNVRFKSEDEEFLMDLTVDTLFFEKTRSFHFHLYFDRIREVDLQPLAAPLQEQTASIFESDEYFRQHMADLELELQTTKENLQSTIEELQTSNEELQATNEELLASNEELQSTNEELHSVNEELYTVNSEFERKNNELKQMNLDYDNLLASTEMGIVFLDMRLCIRKFNPSIADFFKLMPHDIGRSIEDIAYHLPNRQAMLDNISRVLTTGEILEAEEQTNADRWVLIRILPFRAEGSRLLGVLVTFIDITRVKAAEVKLSKLNEDLEEMVMERTAALSLEIRERENTEALLRASERRYQTLVNAAPVGIYRTDSSGKFIFANGHMIEMMGLGKVDALYEGWSGSVHPDDRLELDSARRSCLSGQGDLNIEYRVQKPGAPDIWVLDQCVPEYDSNEGVMGYIGSCLDITKRKQYERRVRFDDYRLVTLLSLSERSEKTEKYIFDIALSAAIHLTESPIGYIYHYDEDKQLFTLHAWSKEVMQECSVQEPATQYGLDKTGLWGEAVRQRRTILVNDFQAPEPLKKGYPSGHVSLTRFLSVPVFAGDRIIAVVGVANKKDPYDDFDENQLGQLMQGILEIIQRKRAEEDLRKERGMLEELNLTLENRVREEVSKNRDKDRVMIMQGRQAAMGEMIGAIAHQWRQPINVVGIILQDFKNAYKRNRLTEEYLEKSVKEGMDVIHHMSQTINDFRNFFKPDKEKQLFSANESISRAISFIEAGFRNSNIAIELDMAEEIFIEGYCNEYAQVLLNVLNNAKDASLQNSVREPKIQIKLFRSGGKAVVTIADNAGGIPDNIVERIFDPYFSTKDEGKGTGIGLYMSKTIIENSMNGRLNVQNTSEGAEFRIEV